MKSCYYVLNDHRVIIWIRCGSMGSYHFYWDWFLEDMEKYPVTWDYAWIMKEKYVDGDDSV